VNYGVLNLKYAIVFGIFSLTSPNQNIGDVSPESPAGLTPVTGKVRKEKCGDGKVERDCAVLKIPLKALVLDPR